MHTGGSAIVYKFLDYITMHTPYTPPRLAFTDSTSRSCLNPITADFGGLAV